MSGVGRVAACVVLLLFEAPLSASAAFIGVEDGRLLEASCSLLLPDRPCEFGPVSATPSAPFAPFDLTIYSDVSSAHQYSSFSSTQISGTLRTRVGDLASVRSVSAHSLFSIIFDVEVATPFSLTGEGTGNNQNGYISYLSLARGTTPIFSATIHGSLEPFATSGELTPGRYTLQAELLNERYPTSQYLAFQLQAVPEPRTALSLGAGFVLLGLGARGRRRGGSAARYGR